MAATGVEARRFWRRGHLPADRSARMENPATHGPSRSPTLKEITAPRRRRPSPDAPDTARWPDAIVSVARPRLQQLHQDQLALSPMVHLVVWARQGEVRAVKALWELNDLRPGGKLTWSHAQWDDLSRAMGDFQRPPDIEPVADPPSRLHECLEEYQDALKRTRAHVSEMERESADREELARSIREALSALQTLCREIGETGEEKSMALASRVRDSVKEILSHVEHEADLTTQLRADRFPKSASLTDPEVLVNQSGTKTPGEAARAGAGG